MSKPSTNTTAEPSVESVRPEPAERARLVVVYSPDDGLRNRVVELGEELLSVGRDAQGLTVADGSMSRLHGRIAYDGRSKGFRATDADSKHGVYVNGKQARTHVLAHGDVMRMGDTLMVFEVGDPMRQTRERIKTIATQATSVVLMGETGTGKDLLARQLHELSGRTGPFVPVNCAALPRELAAAELFGYKKGAFSGADENHAGIFAHADGGTLFLDEVGDLPASVQPVLLRALEERKIRAVGDVREVSVDLRIVSATNHDLAAEVESAKFRSDLYARLAEVELSVPPLRARRSEISILFDDLCREQGSTRQLTTSAMEALLLWDWPFNVRELRSLAKTLSSSGSEAIIDLASLRAVKRQIIPEVKTPRKPPSEETGVRAGALAREQLRQLLERHAGNVSAVARELGVGRTQAYRMVKAYGFDVDSFR